MSVVMNDQKMITLLNDIRVRHLAAYLNLKLNIEGVYRKIVTQEMEKAFLERNTQYHTFYRIDSDKQSLIADYLGITYRSAESSYLLISKDAENAVLFIVNEHGYALAHVPVFGKEQVQDVYDTFESYLTLEEVDSGAV